MNPKKQADQSSSLPQIQHGAQPLSFQPTDDKKQAYKTRRRRSSAQIVVDMGRISEHLSDFETTPRQASEPAPLTITPQGLTKPMTARRNSIATSMDKFPVMLTNNSLRLRKYSCPEIPPYVSMSTGAAQNGPYSLETKPKNSTGSQPRMQRSCSPEKDESKSALERSSRQTREQINAKQSVDKKRRSSTGTQPKLYGASAFAVENNTTKTAHAKTGKQLEEQIKQTVDTRVHESKTKLKTTQSLPRLTHVAPSDDLGWNASIKGSNEFGTFREESVYDSVSTNGSLHSDARTMTTFHEEIISLLSYSSNGKKTNGLTTPKPMANRGRSSIISWIKDVNSIQ